MDDLRHDGMRGVLRPGNAARHGPFLWGSDVGPGHGHGIPESGLHVVAVAIGWVGLLALIAGTVSYLHVHALVARHGQPGWVAALTPMPRSADMSQPALAVDQRM